MGSGEDASEHSLLIFILLFSGFNLQSDVSESGGGVSLNFKVNFLYNLVEENLENRISKTQTLQNTGKSTSLTVSCEIFSQSKPWKPPRVSWIDLFAGENFLFVHFKSNKSGKLLKTTLLHLAQDKSECNCKVTFGCYSPLPFVSLSQQHYIIVTKHILYS